MSTADTWENGQLNLIFRNTAFTGLGDAGGLLPSAAAGNIFISLHSSDPGESGGQNTNEIAYTGYARLTVPRDSTNWAAASGGVTNNLLDLLYGLCTAGSATATHVGIGTDLTGAGKLMFSGALTTSRSISAGDQPRFLATSLTITIT